MKILSLVIMCALSVAAQAEPKPQRVKFLSPVKLLNILPNGLKLAGKSLPARHRHSRKMVTTVTINQRTAPSRSHFRAKADNARAVARLSAPLIFRPYEEPRSMLRVDYSDKKAELIANGKLVKILPISAGANGIGSKPHSKRTPVGKFRIHTRQARGARVIKSPLFTLKDLQGNPQSNTLTRQICLHAGSSKRNYGRVHASLGCVTFSWADNALVQRYLKPGDLVEINQ